MADADHSLYFQTPEMPPQRLVTDNQKTQGKLINSNFLYKALSIAIVLLILPYFPSQAPEFINQTIFTRSWELLHLLVVGIAVSYGLFSRRNVETEKDNQFKADSAQTYVSRILQVSNVFDDDVELETPFGLDESINNKTQAWNSKYLRGNPVVVEETPLLDEEHSASISNNGSGTSKPLFLPVRSLRSAVSNSGSVESVGESIKSVGSISRSSSGAKGRMKEFDDLDAYDLEEKLKESTVVLPSPIPWRSRSGRMEVKEEVDDASPPPYSFPPSYDEPEFDRGDSQSFPSPVSRSSKPSSTSPPKKKASPSPSRSPEKRAKNIEDVGRKKRSSHNCTPPPPPPPPLPTPLNRKYPSPLSNTHSVQESVSSEKKVAFKDELKNFSRHGREDFPRKTADFEMDYLKSEVKSRSHLEAAATAKSVRTIRGGEPAAEAKNYREPEERVDAKFERRSKVVDEEMLDRPRRKSGGPNPQSVSFANQNAESPRPSPKPTLPKYPKRKTKKPAQKVILESEEYSSSEADESGENSDTEKAASDSVSDSAPDPNEVDKKADEFIAKFREQIRLQRIASIKKSSGLTR